MQEISLNGWTALISRTQLDTNYLSKLVDICTGSNRSKSSNKCSYNIRQALVTLLRESVDQQTGLKTSGELKCKLDLVHIGTIDGDDDKFLDQLGAHMKSMNALGVSLLDQNCAKMAKILDKHISDKSDSSNNKKQRVLDLLDHYENKSEISQELLESLALMFESSNSKDVKKTCLHLISACGNRQASLSSTRVKRILSENLTHQNADAFNRQFMSSSAPILSLFKQKLGLNEEQIENLIRLVSAKDRKLLGSLSSVEEFLDMVLTNSNSSNSKLYFDASFVVFVEKILIASKRADNSDSKLK